MKITYWISHCLNDSPCYSIRRKSKSEVLRVLNNSEYDLRHYSKPMKVEVEYDNGFDLMDLCMSGEDRGHWEKQYEAVPILGE